MIKDLWSHLKTAQKPIVLYGMGNGADAVIRRLKKENINVSGFFASDEFVRGQTFHSLPVLTYGEAKEKWGSFIVLTAFGTTDTAVLSNIENIAKEQELYIPDLPVFGTTVFDGSFYSDHETELNQIRESFADERSKNVFDLIINFKLSGNRALLFAAEDQENATIKEIIKLEEHSNIFDLGAFTGDTAEKFLEIFRGIDKVIAVEPDRKNFGRLASAKNEKITCVNAAISYLNGKMRFSSEGGRNQAVNTGKHFVQTTTIDGLSNEFGAPQFIKFDIEGQELNALIGGEETIKNHKPAMMISAYHRGEDIITIPQKVLSLRSDYKMYIRHFPSIPCWDTYYFFI